MASRTEIPPPLDCTLSLTGQETTATETFTLPEAQQPQMVTGIEYWQVVEPSGGGAWLADREPLRPSNPWS